MKKKLLTASTAVLIACTVYADNPAAAQTAHAAPDLRVGQLRCEYLEQPMGVDASSPRLTWVLQSVTRGQRQTAYEIFVSRSRSGLRAGPCDLWDSGKVPSDETVGIRYAGKALSSGQQCWWKVRVWDIAGRPVDSPASYWRTGLLKPSDWKAQWISAQTPRDVRIDGSNLPPPPYLRHTFTIEKAVKTATAFVTAHGVYELHLNGAKVGDSVLAPGWTDYKKRVEYQTYDLTKELRRGQNTVGAILGDGWYSGYVGFSRRRNYYGAPRLGGCRRNRSVDRLSGLRRYRRRAKTLVGDDPVDGLYHPSQSRRAMDESPEQRLRRLAVDQCRYYAYDASLMACMARALGRQREAAVYEALFNRIKTAFNKAYVAPDGRIHGDTQTCYVLALRFGLPPDPLRPLAAKRLADDIAAKNGHLSTGFVGVGYLCPVLSDTGHNDIAYRLLLNDTFPSWGYSIKQGATTIWERWDGWTVDKGFQDPGMNSFNHYSLGSVGQWLYQYVAGIDTDPDSPGYHHIVMHPHPGPGLSRVNATYDSIRGRIVSAWKMENGRFLWNVTIPCNTTATIWVPTAGVGAVTESGKPLKAVPGVKFVRFSGGFAEFELQSGAYQLAAPAPK